MFSMPHCPTILIQGAVNRVTLHVRDQCQYSPPMTPTQKYSPSTVLQKDAETKPVLARQPPMMITGRLPYLFTRMLLIGPV